MKRRKLESSSSTSTKVSMDVSDWVSFRQARVIGDSSQGRKEAAIAACLTYLTIKFSNQPVYSDLPLGQEALYNPGEEKWKQPMKSVLPFSQLPLIMRFYNPQVSRIKKKYWPCPTQCSFVMEFVQRERERMLLKGIMKKSSTCWVYVVITTTTTREGWFDASYQYIIIGTCEAYLQLPGYMRILAECPTWCLLFDLQSSFAW